MAAGAAGAQVAGGIAGGLIQSNAAHQAAGAQQAASQEAAANSWEQYKQTRRDMQPYMKAGTTSLGQYQQMLTGQGNKPPDYTLFTNSPGYQFNMQEGQKALEGSAAARGNLLSGGQAKALAEFGQGLASKQYNSFMDRLNGLSQMGQNSAAGVAQQNSANVNSMNQAVENAGTAQATGTMGAANAWSGALKNAGGGAGTLAGASGGGY